MFVILSKHDTGDVHYLKVNGCSNFKGDNSDETIKKESILRRDVMKLFRGLSRLYYKIYFIDGKH